MKFLIHKALAVGLGPQVDNFSWEAHVSSQKLTVSQVVGRAGVGRASIRHYERIGLVPKAERSPAGYRFWTAREVQYLKWVASAKRAGLTLHELGEIFRMYRAGTAPCRTVRDLLQQKLADLDREVDELSNLRASVETSVRSMERTIAPSLVRRLCTAV